MNRPLIQTLCRLSLGWVVLGLVSCGHPALRQADELSRSNQLAQAHSVLEQALRQAPQDLELRAAQLQVGEQLTQRVLMQIEGARLASRWDEANEALQRLREINPRHARLAWFTAEIARGQRQDAALAQGRASLREGRLERAESVAREILAETPRHPGARLLASQAAQARPLEHGSGELGPAFQAPVTLEFRDAQLRQVFEALSRASGVNFVFDKDVRADAKLSITLRNVSLDEAMRVILSSQQLDRKLLNENSVMVFPATAGKQREHQELITRTLYLTHTDVKQVQAMVRTIAKVRDIHVDERLNLMVVRDTPEVLRLVERLIASVDLPEPEVMLEVEVMELASDKVEAIGLQWPESVQFGLPGAVGQVLLGQRDSFRGSIANPAAVANLRGSAGDTKLLANPKIRVRNRDKARVLIGQKVPVFTTTTNFSGSSSVAASVSYLEVGLKLEVEPTIQLDNDVAIKVNLEVSNLIRQVSGPGGTTAYEIGTRQTSTTLQLADGETQVLAGLINDEDRRNSTGVPGLSSLPLLGSLFGVQSGNRAKTEVVLLITPRIVRNLALPDAATTRLPGGTDASPGAFSSRLRPAARAGVGPAGGTPAATRPATASLAPAAPGGAAASAEVLVTLDVTPQVAVGGTVSVTLRHASAATVRGEIEFDPSRLQLAQVSGATAPGRLPFALTARGERVFVLRALPAAAGQSVAVTVNGLQASAANGASPAVRLEGAGLVAVEAAK